MIKRIADAEDHKCTAIAGVCNACGKDTFICTNCSSKAYLTAGEVMQWTMAHLQASPNCTINDKGVAK